MKRAAQRESELVLLEHAPGLPGSVAEKLVGVEVVVAEVLEGGAMKCIAAAPGDDVDVGTGVAPVGSIIEPRLNLKFLDGVRIRNRNSPASRTAGLQIVHLHAVHLKIVVRALRAMRPEIALRGSAVPAPQVGGIIDVHRDPRRERDNLRVVPRYQRKICHQRVVRDAAQRARFGLQQRRLRADRHLLLQRADLERHIEPRGLRDGDPKASSDGDLETGLRDLDAVRARREQRRHETPAALGRQGARLARGLIRHHNLRLRNPGAGLVSDGPGNGARACRLPAR